MAREKDEWISSAFIGIGLAGMGLFGALAAASATLGPMAIPVWAIASGIVGFTVRSPVARAFADRMSGKVQPEADPALSEEVYAELDDLRVRLAELEERHDFTERLLAARQQQDEERVS